MSRVVWREHDMHFICNVQLNDCLTRKHGKPSKLNEYVHVLSMSMSMKPLLSVHIYVLCCCVSMSIICI